MVYKKREEKKRKQYFKELLRLHRIVVEIMIISMLPGLVPAHRRYFSHLLFFFFLCTILLLHLGVVHCWTHLLVSTKTEYTNKERELYM